MDISTKFRLYNIAYFFVPTWVHKNASILPSSTEIAVSWCGLSSLLCQSQKWSLAVFRPESADFSFGLDFTSTNNSKRYRLAFLKPFSSTWNMLAHNPILPNTGKSINFSFRQPPILQKTQGADELSYIWVSSKSDPFPCDLQRQNQPFYRLQFEVDGSLTVCYCWNSRGPKAGSSTQIDRLMILGF